MCACSDTENGGRYKIVFYADGYDRAVKLATLISLGESGGYRIVKLNDDGSEPQFDFATSWHDG